MKLIVTILEPTLDAALDAIRTLASDHDAIELRLDSIDGAVDLAAVRPSTAKPIILTNRGGTMPDIAAALAAGIDLVDVEWSDALDRDLVRRYRERIVVSHHDYATVPDDLDALIDGMLALGCAHTKLAATPHDFRGNQRLLEMLRGRRGVTIIGMGERGLYSRIAAPFYGSPLFFAARSETRSAAPGQIVADRAAAIYGDATARARLDERSGDSELTQLFAIVGDPAGHSLSPAIHNAIFRERGLAAGYTIASFATFAEVSEPLAASAPFAPVGISITAPFKEEAFAFAQARGAAIGENALAAGSVNTLVRIGDRELIADNTDVDGFATILREVCGRDRKSVALLGAGGTARAALVALRREGLHVTLFNRTVEKASALHEHAEPLHALGRFDGEIIVNTLTAGVDVDLPLRPGMTLIEAGYGKASNRKLDGIQTFDGLDLLRAQAVRQSELFLRTIR